MRTSQKISHTGQNGYIKYEKSQWNKEDAILWVKLWNLAIAECWAKD
jgi:hypothetical protein